LNIAKYVLKEVSGRKGSREKIKKREYFSDSEKKTQGRAVALGSFRTKTKPLFMNSSNQQPVFKVI